MVRFLPVLLVCWLGCREAPVGHQLDGPLFTPEALPGCVASASTFCGEESRAVLDNPEQGFESFYGFAEQLPLAKHPRARVAYTRYWWSELEPTEGSVDFATIDAALAQADANGQTFAFRIMPEESVAGAQRVPKWLADSAGGTWGLHNGVRYFSPDYNSPKTIAAIERTVAALGARYDGDPRLEHVDVGFVGDSGEWAYVVDGASMPSEATTARILDAFAHAFTRTPVLMLIGAVEDGAKPLRAALDRGMGWRADCWGDLRGGWNHHDQFYEQQLTAANAGDAWKTAPVAVETCGDMTLWDTLGYSTAQVRWVLNWALTHHVGLINNKSREVPTRFRPLVDEYLGFAGPRFLVAQASLVGQTLELRVLNRGTTPPLRPWHLALRLGDGPPVQLGEPLTRVTADISARTTLGTAGAVRVALLDERGRVIRLANTGVDADGWLLLFSR